MLAENNRRRHRGILALLFSLKIFLGSACAVNLAVQISPDEDAVPDTAYPGSSMGVESASSGAFNVSLRGVNYGIDAEFPDLVWGLGADTLPGQQPVYWVVDNGFEPSAAGSLRFDDGAGHDLAASYISIEIDTGGVDTLFQNLTIELAGIEDLRSTNGWYGQSAGGFAMAGQFNLRDRDDSLALSFPDIFHTGAGPFEVRIYGLRGADIGGFSIVTVQADTTLLTPVPEPNAVFLIVAVALAALVQRIRAR